MEKRDFEFCISTLAEISDLIIRLAGNANIARKIVSRDDDLETDYNMHTICVDDSEIVEALHDISMMNTHMENGLDWVAHLEKKSC